MAHTVYEHVQKENGKRYIGVTKHKPQRRWRPNGEGYKKNPYFWHAIQKYGWDSFEHNVIAEGLSEDDAYNMERELIAKYKSNDLEHGYNIAPGGAHNDMPEATRQRLSRERKGKNTGKDNPNYGNHKLAGKNNPNYGHKMSEEQKRAISEKKRGKKLPPFTEEHKRKIRENHKGGAQKRAVLCVETGTIYKSINDAARATETNKKQISKCCRGVEHYNTAGGYHWKFASTEELNVAF
jgi:group I intron endonuclease